MKRRLYALMSLVLCFTLLFGSLAVWNALPAEAKSTRLAIVSDVGGTVNVKSAGGSKSYEAYTDMALNEGDYITTEDDSYLVIKIKDTEDELTIGANAEVYVSDLAAKGSGKKSKLKMWAGSLWTSVKKLAGVDEFEVETPTAVMGVRGTNVLTQVDPVTGRTSISVISGSVRTQSNTGSGTGGQTSIIYPSQQFGLDSYDEPGDLNTMIGMIDPSELIHNISPQIIEAIVRSLAYVNQEHDEFVRQKQEELEGKRDKDENSSMQIQNADDLAKVFKNLNNLLGNIVKAAIKNNTVLEDEIRKVINSANLEEEDPIRRLYLDDVQPLDQTAGVDPEKERKRLAELERLEKLKEEKRKKDQDAADSVKQKLQDTLNKLEQEKKRIQQENEKNLKAQKEKALQVYLDGLTAEERQKFLEAQQKNEPKPTPAATPTPNNTDSGSPSRPPAPSNLSAAGGDAKVTLTWSAVPQASYSVWRSDSAYAGYQRIASNVSGTTYTDNNVTNESTYSYYVTAVVNGAESDRSLIMTANPVSGVVKVTGVEITESTVPPISVNGTFQLNKTVKPENATNKKTVWTSDDPAIAEVSESGLVTGKAPGTATITVTTEDGHHSAFITVTVVVPVTGVTVTAPSLPNGVKPGDIVELTAKVAPADATNTTVTWSSANSNVATVDGSGLVTVVGNGVTTITATTADGNFVDDYTIQAAYAPSQGPFTVSIENERPEGYQNGQTFNLLVQGKNLNDIYGIQVIVPQSLFEGNGESGRLKLHQAEGTNLKPASDVFTASDSVSTFHKTDSNIVYAAQFDNGVLRSVTASKVFAKLPFRVESYNVEDDFTFTVKVMIVDKNGNVVVKQDIQMTIHALFNPMG
ncbi:Ig-like domain-containing protein [Paenibacillus contaminans]|uniref:Fibronectin type-III domain-containing protein n=1 Tax=Paenibacillus contaminans TaxID=450362 RepID=A0A329LQW5_9BACL|nr:Ig-like domain-containing protein [Paenibacillus contaminans]RAV09502.1 hypothetical protein DQG23_39390 [Paenibacillus contaminans]